jgi:seryl-tRNA synthetase
MSIDISQLEKAWLKAETAADEVKQEAMRLKAELEQHNGRGENGHDYGKLIVTVEQLKARQEEAERTASAAFDRFWVAQGNGSSGSGSAYA